MGHDGCLLAPPGRSSVWCGLCESDWQGDGGPKTVLSDDDISGVEQVSDIPVRFEFFRKPKRIGSIENSS
jgi:hypothetical protein